MRRAASRWARPRPTRETWAGGYPSRARQENTEQIHVRAPALHCPCTVPTRGRKTPTVNAAVSTGSLPTARGTQASGCDGDGARLRRRWWRRRRCRCGGTTYTTDLHILAARDRVHFRAAVHARESNRAASGAVRGDRRLGALRPSANHHPFVIRPPWHRSHSPLPCQQAEASAHSSTAPIPTPLPAGGCADPDAMRASLARRSSGSRRSVTSSRSPSLGARGSELCPIQSTATT